MSVATINSSKFLVPSAAPANLAGGSSDFSRLLDTMHPHKTAHAATTPPLDSHVMKPLTAADLIGPGGHALRPAAALRPYTQAEVVGSHGKHATTTPQTHEPLKARDFIPGVRSKGNKEHLNPLSPSNSIPHARSSAKDADLEKQAQKWVSQTFFGTLLKQMHDSPFKSELFSGGRGGKAFEPLMDQHLADHMARGSGQKLVRSIVRQLQNRAKHKTPATGGEAELSPADQHATSAPPQSGAIGAFRNMRADVAPNTGN
jgi:Rod binding domain-containing protein